ncbi:ATPase RavA stimulator ViaA [Vibrio sp. WJH972]
MLGVDGINLAMMVAESGIIDSAVNELMSKPQLMLIAENQNVNRSVRQQLLKWQGQVKMKMTKVSETDRFKQELALYQEVIHWNEATFHAQIDNVLKPLEWHSAFYLEARCLLDNEKSRLNPMFPHYFCEQWYQSLLKAVQEAQLSELESNKEKILEDLYQRIETMQTMDTVTNSDDAQSVLRLWNMASAKLSKGDVSVMKKHAEFLKKHKGIQDIAEQLGRMAQNLDCDDDHQSQVEELQLVEEHSQFATDDIVGVEEGDDLNKMLPNETLFLSHPELEVVFYKHLIDKQLMNYHMQGKSRRVRKVTTTKVASKQNELDKGPFIVCIDASGSMRGFPEQCAKATAYALMQIALAENRDCYVMIFSTQIIAYQLTKQDGLREASDFLSYTFKGGTDLEPALSHSVELMKHDRYANADLVVISDFIAPKQSPEVLAEVKSLKQKNNRFHAVSLSKYGNPQLMAMFDHCWSYNPSLMGRLVKKC